MPPSGFAVNGAGMNSHNHPALASVGAWLFRWALGLRLADGTLESPDMSTYGKGFKKALFAPGFVNDPRLPSATGRVTSIYGPIEAAWAIDTSVLNMTLSLPPNTGGEVVLPFVLPEAKITESGNVVWQHGGFIAGASPGVVNGSCSGANGKIHLFVGSGDYSFAVAL